MVDAGALKSRRDALVTESDALQTEIEICVSTLRRIGLLRRLEEVVREIDRIDSTLTRRRSRQ
jgi:hypothetical protein